MSVPLLRTKFSVPPVRSTLVSRPRLLAKLDEGKQEKLTLISASAGFGKTTLLSEWSRHSTTPIAWVGLDKSDNDATHFWTYAIAALQTHAPHIGDTSLALLQSSQTPPSSVFLTALVNDLTGLTEDIILVLDDYHLIEEQAVHDSIIFLLDHFPSSLHLFIAGRIDPPLPLSRLRVREHIVEIRDADLRFTAEEATTFLTERMKLHLSTYDIASLETRTEGWVAGLQLAALSMQGRTDLTGFVHAFTGSHRFILDYLMDEVLHRQPAHIQNFLLQTAVLSRFTAPLCEALTATQDGQSILEFLERSNLFLIPLDHERQWYRYHALFGDVLRARLLATQPEHIPELHQKAATWYEQHDFFADAIHHAFAAKNFVYAADLIERSTESIWKSGELTTFIGWAKALPEDLLRSRLLLCTIYVWMSFLTRQTETAVLFMGYIEQELTHLPQCTEIRGMLAAIQSTVAVMRGRSSEVLALSHQALAQIPAEKRLWRVMPAISLGFAQQYLGNSKEAEQALVEARHSALAAHNHYFALVATSGIGIVQITQAKLRQAVAILQKAQELSLSMGGNLPVTGYIPLCMGIIETERHNKEAALTQFKQALELSSQWQTLDILFNTHFALADAWLTQENVYEARKSFDTAVAIAQKVDSPAYNQEIEAFQVLLWLAEGNLADAIAWANTWQSHAYTGEYCHEFGHKAYARVCNATNRHATALHILAQLLPNAEKHQRVRSVIDMLLIQATALAALHNTAQANKTLVRVLTLTEPEGYIQPYLSEGEPLQRMLTTLLATWQKSHQTHPLTMYMSQLLSSFDAQLGEQKIQYGNAALPEPLSEREMDVLRMLANGASNQDIATSLVVTLSTVKKHVGNILDKLTVTNRTQAILRARELQLF